MIDIEQKALALVREVLAERNLSDKRAVHRELSPYTEALCRAIEQHEAFKQEVSDGCAWILEHSNMKNIREHLSRFIIPKPKPDPLVDIFDECFNQDVLEGETWSESMARKTRAALKSRGLEIREKGQ
jgi:hypothetical protein